MSRIKSGDPQRLAEKLKQLRLNLDLTQEAMFESLRKAGPPNMVLHLGYISRYETGTRVPSLFVLLAYSRLGKVPLERLIDDQVDV